MNFHIQLIQGYNNIKIIFLIFLKVISQQNTFVILENCCHNLPFLWNRLHLFGGHFHRLQSIISAVLLLWCIVVVNTCFINNYEKILWIHFILLKMFQRCLNQMHFWSIVRNVVFICNSSCKIFSIHSFEIHMVSAVSCTFPSRSSNISWACRIICSVVAVFRWPLHGSS